MAIISRRYAAEGVPLGRLRSQTDPNATVQRGGVRMAVEVDFDDAVASVAAMDDAMQRFGFVPAPAAITAAGLIMTSPNGSQFRVNVNNAGALVVTPL